MIQKKIKLAFLAPEIPALSATFVYNEILNLEKKGIEVMPVSIHVPKSPAKETVAKRLTGRTYYLYESGIWVLAKHNLSLAIMNPARYFKTFLMVLSDARKCGFLSRISMGLFCRFLFAAVLANHIKKKCCSHLHCHFAHVSADIAMYASSLSNISFSFTAHANDIFERNWLLKEKIKRSHFAITISNFNKNYMVGLGAKPDKVHVIYCGVNPDAFKSPSRSKNPVPKIGSLGRLVEKKGFDVLIGACKNLKDKNLAFNLEIAGDGPLKNEYQNLVEELGLSSEISFLGPMSHDEVPVWLQGLDAFVLASRMDQNNDMDGIPVVLMEAMMSNVPVVSTRLSGIPELVQDGETGCLADPGDSGSVANALTRILSDKEFCKCLCSNALKTISMNFNEIKNVEFLIKHFNRMTS